MRLVAPDILEDLQGMSEPWVGAGAAVGLLVWVTGWRWQRFWTVLTLTAAAGLAALLHSGAGTPDGPSQRNLLVSATLLAVAAGLLAMELARILAFLAGGVAVCFAVEQVVPAAKAAGVIFLLGGLSTVLLYRFWVICSSSLMGALVFWHCALKFGAKAAGMGPSELAEKHGQQLNGLIITATLAGMLAQMALARRSGAPEPVQLSAVLSPKKWLTGARDLLRWK